MSSNAAPPPTPIFILQNTKPVTKVLFSTFNDDIIYTCNRNGDFTAYSLELRRSIYGMNPENQSLLGVSEIDQANILTYGRSGSIFKWTRNNASYDYKCVYQNELYTFCASVYSEANKLLFVPSKQTSHIDCLDVGTFRKTNTFTLTNDSKLGLLMHIQPIGHNYLLAGYENGNLILFDVRSLKEVSRLSVFPGQPVMGFDYFEQKNFGSCGSAEQELNQFSIDNDHSGDEFSGGSLKLTGSVELTNPGVNSVKIRPSDGKIFAVGGWDHRVKLFGSKKKNLLGVLCFHKDAVNTIDFSGRNLMAVGSNDGIVSFWDLYS